MSDLEEKTLRYWSLSMAWNGRIPTKLQVHDALTETNDLACTLSPTRRLTACVVKLEHEVVVKKRKPKKSKKPIQVTNLQEWAKRSTPTAVAN